MGITSSITDVTTSLSSGVVFSQSGIIDFAETFGEGRRLDLNPETNTNTFSSGTLLSSILDETGANWPAFSTSNRLNYDNDFFPSGIGGYISTDQTNSKCVFTTFDWTPPLTIMGTIYLPDVLGSTDFFQALNVGSISVSRRLFVSGTTKYIFAPYNTVGDPFLIGETNHYWRDKYLNYVFEYKSDGDIVISINGGGEEDVTQFSFSNFYSISGFANRIAYGGSGAGAVYGRMTCIDGIPSDYGVTVKDCINSLASQHGVGKFVFPNLQNLFTNLNGGTPATWPGIENAGDTIVSPGNTPLDIIVAAGQSNMVASASGDTADSILDRAHPDVWVKEGDTGTIRGSQMPVDFRDDANTGVTPAMAFARYYAENQLESGRKTIIICAAQSGTNLYSQWAKATGTLYTDMINDINSVLALNPNNRLVGVYWSQGESDASQTNPQATYETNFTNFINDVRTDLSLPDLPFVISGLNPEPYTDQAGTDEIIAAQVAVANDVSNVVYTGWNPTAWGDGTKPAVFNTGSDSVHFGGDANRVRGVVAAREFVNYLNNL